MNPNEKILLEPLRLSHVPHIMSWINDKDSLHYFATLQKEISEADEVNYIQKMILSQNDKCFSIFLVNDNEKQYVGQCSINQIYWPSGNGRLFIYIKKEFRLMGLGKDVMTALENFGFKQLNLHKLWLIVRSNNKSWEGYQSRGYKIEGRLIDEYFVQNKFYDMIRLYKLKN